ncbi:hypothetical protein [Pyrobaculum ferrireducens]|uniref:Uncharacterized protein n=1 Tax=Pyrobaculum ferrireducens TaxID=1104324 RepID=G7VHH3_9CREN|nr:hypothetical protein [Pyrobaculum ferrireducens]AET33264.1 hypothetical protein P186_1862 [Pyrobaculum ferrireducens]
MARRYCPTCRKTVDEDVAKEGSFVIKKCPQCGYIFAKYEVKSVVK